MSYAVDFFKNMKEEMLDSINTGVFCRVLSTRDNQRFATVQPLYSTKGSNENLIEDAPVLRHARGSLEVGKIVFVVISKYSIDAAITGRTEEPFSRRFSTNDGVVVGVFD